MLPRIVRVNPAACLAAATTPVVDIPAADGGIQRFLHIRPDAPIACVVQFPGGNGHLGIHNDGSTRTRVGRCNLSSPTAAAAR